MQLKIDFEKKQLTVTDVLNLKDLLEFVERFVGEDNYADWVFLPEKQKEYLISPPPPVKDPYAPPFTPYCVDGTGSPLPTLLTKTTSNESGQFTFVENKVPFRGPVNQYPLSKEEDYVASIEEVKERVPETHNKSTNGKFKKAYVGGLITK